MKSVQYPDGWFFVERAVVILFGLSAQLAPTLNTVRVGFPYIMQVFADRNRLGQQPAASESRPAQRHTSSDEDRASQMRLN